MFSDDWDLLEKENQIKPVPVVPSEGWKPSNKKFEFDEYDAYKDIETGSICFIKKDGSNTYKDKKINHDRYKKLD